MLGYDIKIKANFVKKKKEERKKEEERKKKRKKERKKEKFNHFIFYLFLVFNIFYFQAWGLSSKTAEVIFLKTITNSETFYGTERQKDRKTERQKDRKKQKDRKAYRQKDRKKDRNHKIRTFCKKSEIMHFDGKQIK